MAGDRLLLSQFVAPKIVGNFCFKNFEPITGTLHAFYIVARNNIIVSSCDYAFYKFLKLDSEYLKYLQLLVQNNSMECEVCRLIRKR